MDQESIHYLRAGAVDSTGAREWDGGSLGDGITRILGIMALGAALRIGGSLSATPLTYDVDVSATSGLISAGLGTVPKPQKPTAGLSRAG